VEELTPEEVRVLGCLIEKERTVPDSYPLTLNALVGACNQTSNRDPVVAYEPHQVEASLMQLRSRGLTRVVHSPGQRAEKYRHVVGDALGLEHDTVTVLAPLLLRGPQTVNELKTRTERYEPGVPDVDDALRVLASREEPLVVNLGRRPGQREERWMHLLAGAPDPSGEHDADDFAVTAASNQVTSPLADRIAALEERVARLEAELGGI
jgi:uncharacterized protein YceH (UPF0502 family)